MYAGLLKTFTIFEPISKFGKRQLKDIPVASDPSSKLLSLCLFMKDIESGIWFLTDSSSAVSILPMSLFKKPSGQSYQNLFAANDSKILVTGCQELKIDFNTSKKFIFNFLVGMSVSL